MRVAFCGAGAVGASLSADLINAGVDVTVIDPWASMLRQFAPPD